MLQISGERFEQEAWPLDSINRRQVERWVGGFVRRFRLPENVIIDRISAELDLGVLTITAPKQRRFPAVQWFVPISLGGTEDTSPGRSSRSWPGDGSLADAFPRRRLSNSSDGSNDSLRLSHGDDAREQSRASPPRASLAEVDDDADHRRPSKQRASQRRSSGASGGRQSNASGGNVQNQEARPDEVPTQASDVESEAAEEPEVDENAEAAVRMVLDQMLQSLAMDQGGTNRENGGPNQSRRSSKASQSSRQSSAGSSNASRDSSVAGKSGSRRPSRRASQANNASTGDTFDPPETSASTENLMKSLESTLQRRISQTVDLALARRVSQNSSAIHSESNAGQDSGAGNTGSRRGSRRESQNNENALRRRRSDASSENSTDQDGSVSTGSRRPSERLEALQSNDNSLQRRSSQKSPQANVGQDTESNTTGSRRASRRPSQNTDNAQQRRIAPNRPASEPQIVEREGIVAVSAAAAAGSRRASSSANEQQGRSSQNINENETEPYVRQDSEPPRPNPRRVSTGAPTVENASERDATTQAVPSVPDQDSPDNALQRRSSQTEANDVQRTTAALENILLNASEKASADPNA